MFLFAAAESENRTPEIENIRSNTKAIMFYSVPHRGSTCADYNLPFLRKSIEVTEVQRSKYNNIKNINFVLTKMHFFRL